MRRVSRIMLCVVLGLVTSCGVTGYGWYAIHAWRQGGVRAGEMKVVTAGGEVVDADGRLWNWTALRQRWFTIYEIDLAQRPLSGWQPNDVLPDWMDLWGRVAVLNSGETLYGECQYGAPFRCLRAVVAIDYNKSYETSVRYAAGIDIGWRDGGYTDQGTLPSGPLWLGMIADVAIFAVAWLALLEILGLALRVRQQRRIRRGFCVCGYDRTGLAGGMDAKCPECGAVPAPAPK